MIVPSLDISKNAILKTILIIIIFYTILFELNNNADDKYL